jgi:hypothetical protein
VNDKGRYHTLNASEGDSSDATIALKSQKHPKLNGRLCTPKLAAFIFPGIRMF